MKKYSRVCANIDLDAFLYNADQLYSVVQGEQTKMVAVIKADGYGHGSVPLAHAIQNVSYLWGFGVATLDEAIQLRNHGVTKPILVLGCVFPDQYEEAVQEEIRITVYTLEAAKALAEVASRLGKDAILHIKIDTGMSRIGFLPTMESVQDIKEIAALNHIKIEGMFTHFSKADEIDKSFTKLQVEKYAFMQTKLREEGIDFHVCHISNSAGIIDVPAAHMDMVRAGIALYGIYPSKEVNRNDVKLAPVMSIVSHVAHVKWVEANTAVSYGGTYISEKPIRIATIPVGYGDGYPRSLSSKGWVIIRGKKAPILGRICMDQFMVDVTEIGDVSFGDKVTLLGTDGEETILVETLSDLSERFPYEFVCDIGKRIPRSYFRNGELVDQIDFFL